MWAAAGIAATFNAPLAGVAFAVEIILGSAAIRTFSPIVVASVIATAISRWLLGNAPAFVVPVTSLESELELINYVVLGLVAGLVGVGFIRMLYNIEDRLDALPGLAVPVVGGLLVGVIGLLSPRGVRLGLRDHRASPSPKGNVERSGGVGGREDVGHESDAGWWWLGRHLRAVLIHRRHVGGLLGRCRQRGESLADGCAHPLTPWSGWRRWWPPRRMRPLTAIIIIFELTSNYTIILPVMLATITASVLSISIQPESIYTLKLVRRGISLRERSRAAELVARPVREVMAGATHVLPPELPFGVMVDRVLGSVGDCQYVVDPRAKSAWRHSSQPNQERHPG